MTRILFDERGQREVNEPRNEVTGKCWTTNGENWDVSRTRTGFARTSMTSNATLLRLVWVAPVDLVGCSEMLSKGNRNYHNWVTFVARIERWSLTIVAHSRASSLHSLDQHSRSSQRFPLDLISSCSIEGK